MSDKTHEILEQLKTLSLLEASQLVKQIEEAFGVDASRVKPEPIIVPVIDDRDLEIVDKTEFDVILEEFPSDKKIAILKVVRTITGLGLKEAKDFVESVPKPLKEGISPEDAEDIKKQLEDAGAKITIK